MATIDTLLTAIRFRIGDMAGSKYSDFQLLNAWNDVNKEVRRLLLQHAPMSLVGASVSGNTVAGQHITLENNAAKILEIRINGAQIKTITPAQIADKTQTGLPLRYYLTGRNKINLWPVPDAVYLYEVTMIGEVADLAEDADSGLPAEIESLVVNNIAGIITGSAGVDLESAIIKYFGKVEPDDNEISGYWG